MPASAAVNPVAFGADSAGVNDSAPALNAALLVSGDIEFPPGKFKFLSPVAANLSGVPASVRISGAGADNTVLFWPSGGGLAVNYSSARHSAHIRDLSLTTGSAGIGAALTLNNSILEGNFAQTEVENVTIRGDDGGQGADYWSTGIAVQGVSNINLDTLLIYGNQPGTGGNGITLAGNPSISPNYGIVYNIDKCGFYNLGTGLLYGSDIQGVTVSQSNFVNGVTGICSPSGAAGILAQLTVQGCNFNTTGNQIATLTAIDQMVLLGNIFYVPENATGVYMPDNNFLTIVGNHFTYVGGNVGNTGVIVGPSRAGSVSAIAGNTFLGLACGINLQASSSGVNVQSNAYANVATPVSNAGTGNTVGGSSH